MPNPGFFFFFFGQTCEDGVLGVQEEEKTISQIWLHVIGICLFFWEPHYILATS
jgi:hypothetical protein